MNGISLFVISQFVSYLELSQKKKIMVVIKCQAKFLTSFDAVLPKLRKGNGMRHYEKSVVFHY